MIKSGLYIYVIVIVLLLSGCKKFEENKNNKLEGNWLQVIPLATGSVNKVVWSFSDDSLVTSSVYYPDTVMIDSGKYWVDMKSMVYYLYIEDLDYWLDGNYRLLKSTKEMMFIQRIEANFPGPFYRREFIKDSD